MSASKGEVRVVAIDGPVGSGKTTVARLVAHKLGYVLVDTGALYRCLALQADQEKIDFDDGETLGRMAAKLQVRFAEGSQGQRVWLAEEEVTTSIREPRISQAASKVSVHPAVRDALLDTQREFGRRQAVVMEGRDIGTVVFPEAPIKVFVQASAEVRARRRFEELRAKGKDVDWQSTLQEVQQRDQRDEQRAVAPLKPAADAVILDTSPLSAEQVADQIVALVEARAQNDAG